jgi:hypothetical protein
MQFDESKIIIVPSLQGNYFSKNWASMPDIVNIPLSALISNWVEKLKTVE